MVFLSQISGLEWILDRMEGLEDRDYAAGVTLRHRICASMMTDSIKIVVQLTVFIGLLTTVYGMEVHGAWVLALGIVFMAAFEGVAIGEGLIFFYIYHECKFLHDSGAIFK